MKLCLTRLDLDALDVLGGGGGLRVEDADNVLTFDGGNALLLATDGEGAHQHHEDHRERGPWQGGWSGIGHW
jgi:hypothetical protein